VGDAYICDKCGMTVCADCCDYDEEEDYVTCNDCKEEESNESEESSDE